MLFQGISNIILIIIKRREKQKKRLNLKVEWHKLENQEYCLLNMAKRPFGSWHADAVIIDRYGDFYLVQNIWTLDFIKLIKTERDFNVGYVKASSLTLKEARALLKKELTFKNFK